MSFKNIISKAFVSTKRISIFQTTATTQGICITSRLAKTNTQLIVNPTKQSKHKNLFIQEKQPASATLQQNNPYLWAMQIHLDCVRNHVKHVQLCIKDTIY